jgi:hypothetical protein
MVSAFYDKVFIQPAVFRLLAYPRSGTPIHRRNIPPESALEQDLVSTPVLVMARGGLRAFLQRREITKASLADSGKASNRGLGDDES